mgnify:CR=1 FL=1
MNYPNNLAEKLGIEAVQEFDVSFQRVLAFAVKTLTEQADRVHVEFVQAFLVVTRQGYNQTLREGASDGAARRARDR